VDGEDKREPQPMAAEPVAKTEADNAMPDDTASQFREPQIQRPEACSCSTATSAEPAVQVRVLCWVRRTEHNRMFPFGEASHVSVCSMVSGSCKQQ
jgi:hypothetical protein